jgi:hypothetical protein
MVERKVVLVRMWFGASSWVSLTNEIVCISDLILSMVN